MNGYIFLPPEGHRATARQLAKLAGYQTISFDNQKACKLKYDAIVVNWGNSTFPRKLQPAPVRIYNKPLKIANGINKINAFGLFNEHNIPCPEWTTDEEKAQKWFNAGDVVYARTLVSSTSGEGINLLMNKNPQTNAEMYWRKIPSVKFYTRRFNCKQEFRVHVFGDEVIHIQQKKKRQGEDPQTAHFVKNLSNGYIFAIQDVECPQPVLDACIKAVKVAEMDFGAVDVGFKPSSGKFCLFEINSRPALSGTTLIKYAEKLKELV